MTPAPASITLTNGEIVTLGDNGGSLAGIEFAPTLNPDLIEFTRPPLVPGADVSSIPPPDNCAGYLGAGTDPSRIGLIRMPHVATWFDTTHLTPTTPFVQEETTYISFSMYGAAVGIYDPTRPQSGSFANQQLLVDSTGGSTIVVWPRSLTLAEQSQVFAYAQQRNWVLMRGSQAGPLTTANLLIRLKGDSPTYQGGYTPTAYRTGVPCYFNDHPGAAWSAVSGSEFVASPQNIGTGAPQGVNCTVQSFLSGACLTELQAYISSTGGNYYA
jgi:hypothetical protein